MGCEGQHASEYGRVRGVGVQVRDRPKKKTFPLPDEYMKAVVRCRLRIDLAKDRIIAARNEEEKRKAMLALAMAIEEIEWI